MFCIGIFPENCIVQGSYYTGKLVMLVAFIVLLYKTTICKAHL